MKVTPAEIYYRENNSYYGNDGIDEGGYSKYMTFSKFLDKISLIKVLTEPYMIYGNQSSGAFISGRDVILQPYAIGEYEITQEVFYEIMNETTIDSNKYPSNDKEKKEDKPVESINWYQAIAFCNKLSIRRNFNLCYSIKDSDGNELDWKKLTLKDIPTEKNELWDSVECDFNKTGYRLPTVAEWEFAARGGLLTESNNKRPEGINYKIWHEGNSNGFPHVMTEINNFSNLSFYNSKIPYDIYGNVWEWCYDWYEEMKTGEVINPTGPSSGSYKVLRGGCFNNNETELTPTFQIQLSPDTKGIEYGFRLARTIINKKPAQVLSDSDFNLYTEMICVTDRSVEIIGEGNEGCFPYGRNVTLDPYKIGRFEITQGVYQDVMGENPSTYSSYYDYSSNYRKPVNNINWYHAIAFCNKLSLRLGKDPCYSVKKSDGTDINWSELMYAQIPDNENTYWDNAVCDFTKNGFRLPTEAEWEFAARGAAPYDESWNLTYANSNYCENVAWYEGNSSFEIHEVGIKDSNRLGICDMSGNVSEWCFDVYSDELDSGNLINPVTVQGVDNFRCIRGGNCGNSNIFCGTKFRTSSFVSGAWTQNGIRVVCRITN